MHGHLYLVLYLRVAEGHFFSTYSTFPIFQESNFKAGAARKEHAPERQKMPLPSGFVPSARELVRLPPCCAAHKLLGHLINQCSTNHHDEHRAADHAWNATRRSSRAASWEAA